MGNFSITNNSSAVLTKISSVTEATNAFNITSGSLPISNGQSVSGHHIEINDDQGNQYGTINLFFIDGYTKITYQLNSDIIYSNVLFGSGFAQLQGPVVGASDNVVITIENAVQPTPTPTPSATPNPSPTPTGTPGPTPTPSSTPAIYDFLLDTYSGATTAISLRKLSSTYSGDSIRVRRSSDDAETDIGFNGNVLDTSALLSFVGSGSGYIAKAYDQSGNGNDFVQSSINFQPIIVSGGTLVVDEFSKPVFRFDGINDSLEGLSSTGYFLSGGANYLASVVCEYNPTYDPSCFFSQSDGLTTNGTVGFLAGNSNQAHLWWANDLLLLGNYEDMKLICELSWDGTTRLTSINNIPDASDTPVGKNTLALPTYLGRIDFSGNNFFANGYMQEFIIWNSDQSANVTNIKSEQNVFYGAY